MLRAPAVILFVLLSGCDSLSQTPRAAEPVGAVRIETSVSGATLYVDAMERAPLSSGMQVELSAGPHVLEARQGSTILSRASIEVQPARIMPVSLVPIEPQPVAQANPIAAQPGPAPLPSGGTPGSPIPSMPTAPADPPSNGALPATPSRADILNAMTPIALAVRTCSNEQHSVQARIVFAGPTGRVASVVAEGEAPEDVRACVASAVRGAQVPPFSQATLAVSYPFRVGS